MKHDIEIAQEARIKLARVLSSLEYNLEIPYPDISTKSEAQNYIGLDMGSLIQEKKLFLQTVLPVWIKTGRERERQDFVSAN